MFSIILKVLFALTSLWVCIYLFQLKERYPDLTKAGWYKVLSGVLLLFGFSLIEILDEFPNLKAVIFGSPIIPLFLEIVIGILGLMLITFGMISWLTEISFLKKKTEEREKEFLFLEFLSSKTKKSSSLIETLENSLKEVTGFLRVEASAIWITNPATQELILASYKGLPATLVKKFENLDSENGIIKEVARNKEPIIQEEIPSTEEILMELKKENFVSLALAPILGGDKNMGILALFSKERYKLDSKIGKLLENISSNLGEKIDTLRLAKEVKRKTDQLTQAIQENQILSVISGYLVSNLDFEQILDRIIWEGLKVIEAKVGHIVLVTDKAVEVRASLDPAFYGLKSDLAEFPLIKEVLDRRKNLVNQTNLLVPIFARNQILGVLWFENPEAEKVFTQKEVQQAQALANQASLAIQNSQLKQELEEAHRRLSNIGETQRLSAVTSPGPNFANDMNNILAAILGNTQLLQNKLASGELPYNSDLSEYLKIIEQSVVDGSQVIGQLQNSYPAPTEEVSQITTSDLRVFEPEVTDKLAKKLKVLAIDDQRMILDLLSSMFANLGHTTEVADTGQEGIEKFKQDSFDLVITDLGLLDISGFEVSQKIKERNPEVPIVMITGWGANFDKDQLRKAGVDYILAKPFKLEQLTEVVEKITAQRQSAIK
ncbi:MAG: hypothetical protein A2145_02825 [candidate division Zixibacteria bacterium RBG_16_40_9]|nr:MAG: hypothetical protein A2145_02825 [candidate division Zixibacteria bacterium RBG_16_40_9]